MFYAFLRKYFFNRLYELGDRIFITRKIIENSSFGDCESICSQMDAKYENNAMMQIEPCFRGLPKHSQEKPELCNFFY